MNRIEKAFQKGKAFIPFITARRSFHRGNRAAYYRNGKGRADIIEIGIPFSDPSAESCNTSCRCTRPISRDNNRQILEMVKRIRKVCDVPLVFMTYINPVFSYGTDRFLKTCKEIGVDGIIVPDVPYEERDEIKPFCEKYGIACIPLIAPTSKDRIDLIAKEAEGFVYCVSSFGVTGVREDLGHDFIDMIKRVKLVKDIPCAIGFGISNPDQARLYQKFQMEL